MNVNPENCIASSRHVAVYVGTDGVSVMQQEFDSLDWAVCRGLEDWQATEESMEAVVDPMHMVLEAPLGIFLNPNKKEPDFIFRRAEKKLMFNRVGLTVLEFNYGMHKEGVDPEPLNWEKYARTTKNVSLITGSYNLLYKEISFDIGFIAAVHKKLGYYSETQQKEMVDREVAKLSGWTPVGKKKVLTTEGAISLSIPDLPDSPDSPERE
jgi:hypothetical protein